MRVVGEDVRFQYPGAASSVLQGVSFDVASGATAAIVGPSGSGKTTLVSILGGLLRPQHGRFACVDDQGCEHDPAQVVAWVLQTVSLLPHRTVVDNVRIGAYLDGADRAEASRRAVHALELVGLGDRAGAPARELSGGEGQRVAIARALASDRPVILADEPTGNLDEANTARVLDAMFTSAGAPRRTVLMVTHDLRAAARCDVTFRMGGGRLHPVAT